MSRGKLSDPHGTLCIVTPDLTPDRCSCPSCAVPLEDDFTAIVFRVPDALVGSPGLDAVAMADACTLDLGTCAYLRVHVPIPLDTDHELCLDPWIRLDGEEAERARTRWGDPELVLAGPLANALPLWGLLGAGVLASFPPPGSDLPDGARVIATGDRRVEELLTRRWSAEQVLPYVDPRRRTDACDNTHDE